MPEAAPPNVQALLAGRRRILVTGGAGFNCCAEAKGYGGAVVQRLMAESDAEVFNLDKLGYASDPSSIEAQPLFGQQGRQRSPGERLAPHLGPAGGDFPEKLIPLYGDGGNVRYWAGYLGSSRQV